MCAKLVTEFGYCTALRTSDPSRIERLAQEFGHWAQVRTAFRGYAARAPAVGAFLTDRVEALERSMAGFHPDQLELLTDGIDDKPEAVEELALLARETGWRLREIIYEVWRRWPELATSPDPGERALSEWLRDLEQRLQPGSSSTGHGTLSPVGPVKQV